jgi:hypothetical protein
MIRRLLVYCAPVFDYSKDGGKTAAETVSVEMVMGAVQALFKFSLLVSQHNPSDLFLTALNDSMK